MRKAIADDGEHRRPEERLADGVDAQRDQRHGERRHRAGQIQADAGDDRADEQQADRRKLQRSFDEVGTEAQAEHDGRSPDEQILALLRGEQVAGDVLNPAVGAEFDGADQGVRDEQDEQQDRAEGKLRDDADGDQQRAADGVADQRRPVADALKMSAKNFESRKQATAAPSMPTGLNISAKLAPFAAASDFGNFCPMNMMP